MDAESRQARGHYRIRPLSLAHIPIITAWHEQLEDLSLFDRHMPLPASPDAMEAMWREIIVVSEPRTSHWFVIDDADSNTVGMAGLQNINYFHGDAVIAALMSRSARGRGIGRRVSALLLDLAFDQLRLTRVTSYYRTDNAVSRAMFAACGFKQEGCIREGWFSGGRHLDLIVIGILAEEWRKQRVALASQLGPETVVVIGNDPRGSRSWPPSGAENAVATQSS